MVCMVTCMWESFLLWLLSLAFYFVLVKLISLGCLLAILSLDVLGKVWKRHREERFKGWTVLSLKDKELINGRFFLVDGISCLILSYSPSIYFSPWCALGLNHGQTAHAESWTSNWVYFVAFPFTVPNSATSWAFRKDKWFFFFFSHPIHNCFVPFTTSFTAHFCFERQDLEPRRWK